MKMQQYCSVCKAEYEMEVVPTGDDDGVLWLQCPVCKGYLPKVRSVAGEAKVQAPVDSGSAPDPTDEAELVETDTDADLDSDGAVVEEAGAPAAESVGEGSVELSAMDPESAVPYRPWQTYEVGAALHHLAWDDYGVVLAKETLPGNRRVVKVRFQDAGIVRLREDDET